MPRSLTATRRTRKAQDFIDTSEATTTPEVSGIPIRPKTPEEPVYLHCVELLDAESVECANRAWRRAVAENTRNARRYGRDHRLVAPILKRTQHALERLIIAHNNAEQRYVEALTDYGLLRAGYQRIGYSAAYIIAEKDEASEAFYVAERRLIQAQEFLANMRKHQKESHIV